MTSLFSLLLVFAIVVGASCDMCPVSIETNAKNLVRAIRETAVKRDDVVLRKLFAYEGWTKTAPNPKVVSDEDLRKYTMIVVVDKMMAAYSVWEQGIYASFIGVDGTITTLRMRDSWDHHFGHRFLIPQGNSTTRRSLSAEGNRIEKAN